MKIDILLGTGLKGGVENVINSILDSDAFSKDEIRVVQMVYEGVNWLNKKSAFYPLLFGKDNHDLDEMEGAYVRFILENGCPDIILTDWPYLCFLAAETRKILVKNKIINNESKVLNISYLHNMPEYYENAGFGNAAYLGMADCHIALSKRIDNDLSNIFPDQKVIRLYNPVVDSISDRKSNKKQTKTLTYIGRIDPIKRIDLIIDALSKTKDQSIRLRVIGDADESNKLYFEELIEEAKEKRVFARISFMGWRENPYALCNDTDFIIAASDDEGFMLSGIEALSKGIPVITTPVGIMPEVIVPGENGYLFPCGDSENLAMILDEIYCGNLPVPDNDKCEMTALPFVKETALSDMRAKLSIAFHDRASFENTCITKDELYINDKLSVIIPCHNAENYIEQCLNSLFSSDFPIQMLEVIVVNDASTDLSLEILKEFEKKYSDNFLLVNLNKNVGEAEARNIGMQYASGNFISFVDADDLIFPNAYRLMYEMMRVFDLDFIMGGIQYFPIKNNVYFENRFYDLTKNDIRKDFLLKVGYKNNCVNRMYKADIILSSKSRFISSKLGADMSFVQQINLASRRVMTVSSTVYGYRWHDLSAVHKQGWDRYRVISDVEEKTYDLIYEKYDVKDIEEELELIYFINTFSDPLNFIGNTNGIEKNIQILLHRFPDILENKYIKNDESGMREKLISCMKKS